MNVPGNYIEITSRLLNGYDFSSQSMMDVIMSAEMTSADYARRSVLSNKVMNFNCSFNDPSQLVNKNRTHSPNVT